MTCKPKFEDGREVLKILSEIKDASRQLAKGARPQFNGERFLTDKELDSRLNVSRRTLTNYRANGIIGYYIIGGKTLYAESENDNLLKANYIPPFA